jgi:light-regulated signal transduction histidine kinase (bacteriophytochrome)
MQLEIQQDTSGDFHPALAKATSRGLHDTAQPLTVLQGLLEFTLMQAQTVQEYRESLTTALAEMSRLTACFENVRQLVRLQQPAADICDFSLREAAQTVADQFRSAGREVEISAESNSQCWVRASQSRFGQALSLLISSVALSVTDRLRISIEEWHSDEVTVRIRTAQIDGSLSLNLEMARLVAASAGGELRSSETPVSLLLVLPKATKDQSADKKGTLNHV